jgi:carbon-monoxide dehydrogenase medium subunit
VNPPTQPGTLWGVTGQPRPPPGYPLVKPAAFEYHASRTVEEAIAALAAVAPLEGRVLAGGQTLVPAMAMRLARPAHLVDINGVAGFDRLEWSEAGLRIGPCVRHATLGAEAVPGPLGRLLSLARRHIAHSPIRARGTFCGSLANADAASEWCLVAVALDATLTARSERGTRRLAAKDFLVGYMTTALEPDELLTEAHLPALPPGTRVGFYEFSRRAGDFAEVMALATYELRDGIISTPRIAVGAIEGCARRLRAAEAALDGQRADDAGFHRAAETAAAEIDPPEAPDDTRCLVRTAVSRALASASHIRHGGPSGSSAAADEMAR